MRPFHVLSAFALMAAPAAAAAQIAPAKADAEVRRIMKSASFKKAAAALREGHQRWVEETIALTEIPAPPFKEEARAKAYLEMFRQRGLSDVEIDEEGNVLGLRKGTGGGGLVIVSAHLDTVFPEGTDVKVRREGEKLHAPGIGDDSAGLAAQLSLIDAMKSGNIRTKSDILFVGTVGEEGLGDLRGVRHLFNKGKYKGRAKAFFSLDGTGTDSVVTGGAGSKRYRVTFKGPGGHSYGAFGLVNPAAALAVAISELYRLEVPKAPKTTYNVGVLAGGTSVNTIPETVSAEIDMRSESAEALAALERSFLATLPRAAEAENKARSTSEGPITFEAKPVGDRPAGQTPESADIVRFAAAAYRAEGVTLTYHSASTDANLPISLGIPSVTMARVATGGRAHAPDEWIGIEKAANVKLKRILLATILATARMR
jgi:acetylornithine deacetylase/succinyl-diaminopimelate desuccinylase-like protein